jgi:hypothetical protein
VVVLAALAVVARGGGGRPRGLASWPRRSGGIGELGPGILVRVLPGIAVLLYKSVHRFQRGCPRRPCRRGGCRGSRRWPPRRRSGCGESTQEEHKLAYLKRRKRYCHH